MKTSVVEQNLFKLLPQITPDTDTATCHDYATGLRLVWDMMVLTPELPGPPLVISPLSTLLATTRRALPNINITASVRP